MTKQDPCVILCNQCQLNFSADAFCSPACFDAAIAIALESQNTELTDSD